MAKERSSNIELLRILLALGVIVLHYNNPDIGGALRLTQGSNYQLLVVLESIAICAVNTFVLISGYYMCKSGKRETVKAFALILQVIVFKLAGYGLNIIMAIRGGESLGNVFSWKQLFLTLYNGLIN